MPNVISPGLFCSPALRPKKAAPLRTSRLRFHRLFELDALHRNQRGAAAD